MTEIPPTFLLQCRSSVIMMRRVGMNDVQIACVLQDARSAALNEEFFRLRQLVTTNPPTHHPHGELVDLIEQWGTEMIP